MRLNIWGARGSIPTPLKSDAVEGKIRQAIQALWALPDIKTYSLESVLTGINHLPPLLRGTAGGNTACVEVQAEGETLILDAGSGLRELGLALMRGPCGRGQGTLHLFISHPHWDHIHGFPFFVPAFIPGNRIFIYGVHDLQTAFEDQQRPLNFPIPLAYMRAEKTFVPLQVGEPFSIGRLRINTIQNAHPGHSYGYRIEDQHSVLVYASDAEYKQLDDASVQAHIAFFRNADALLFDAQYTLREGWLKEDWGHSSAMIGVDLARAAGVKRLLLFHHEPTYSDADLQKICSDAFDYQTADTTLPTCEVLIAYEGLTLDLSPPGAVAVQLTPDGDAAILTPASVFDERSVDQVAEQLAGLTAQETPASPIIDLSQVETLTTASLKLLVKQRRKGEHAPIVLAAPSESVRQVIVLGGYQDYFAIYPSVDAALEAAQVREALNLPGQIIQDRYQIVDTVARGWLGTVLKATDLRTHRPVALKILSSTFSKETIARFMRQAEQVLALEHPNIVRAFTWAQEGDYTVLAEELMTGPMLHDLLTDDVASLAANQALDIALDIARALEYIHSRGVIHGDVKPRNVFLVADEDGGRFQVKLSGVGLGRLEEGRSLVDAPLLFLSPAYLAPEQILGQTLDARTDLYALGVILYELFARKLPFDGVDQEVMQAHLRRAPRSPRELTPDLSPSLEHLILKLLSKHPNERYANAGQVRRILDGLLVGAEETARQRRRLLVGREPQMRVLRQCWEQTSAGHGQLVFVSGEPGIGKTSLAQQAATQCQPPVFLTGRCTERKGEAAYNLFAQILRGYFATVPPELLDEQARQLLGNFASIVPEVRQIVPDLQVPLPLEPQQEQLRLMVSLTQFIQRATAERPWFLILDDLQWADPSSLELLQHLGRNVATLALMVIAIYRDIEVERGHPLQKTLRDLSTHPTYHHLSLDRLDQQGVGLILANLWWRPVPEALTARIYAHTGGNPFYVEEVAKGLVDDGFITLRDGAWQFPAPEVVRLPESVHEVVWRRVGHLSAETQAVLRQAAVLGQTFRFDVLREMSELSEWELLDHLSVALERQLAEEVAGDAVLRFRHAEIRAVLYADLGALRRRILHRQAGEALERLAQPEPERIAEELAHHFGEAGDYERAIGYSAKAARQAQAAYANEDALLWYNRTLEMVEQLGPERASQFASLHVSAHESLGEVLTLVGRYDEALTHYAVTRTLVEIEPLPPDHARHLADLCRQTARLYERRSEYDTAFEWVEKGLGYLDKDEPTVEAARLYLRGAWSFDQRGNRDEALEWYQRSLTTVSQIKTREGQRTTAQVYNSLGATYLLCGDFDRVIQFCRESLKISQQIDDVTEQSVAYNNLGSAYYSQGNWHQASEVWRKGLAIAQEIGAIYNHGMVANNLALICLNRGEWDQALRFLEQSMAICKQIGATKDEAAVLSNLAQVHIYQENWSEAHACLHRSQAMFAEVGSAEFLPELERRWGELYLKIGELDQALDHTRGSIHLAAEQGNPWEEGMSQRMLGQVWLAREAWELAGEALHQSLRILSDLHSEFEVAKTKLALVHLAVESNSVSDEAQVYLAQAIEIFEKLGAQGDLALAQDLSQHI